MFLRLTGGPYTVLLAPQIGGALAGAWFNHEGQQRPILRPAGSDLEDATASACFPLAPFCNRLRDGRLSFRGQDLSLPLNLNGLRHPLHGQAWRGSWIAEQGAPNAAKMIYRHSPGHWPWRYEAEQTLIVSEDGIFVGLTLTNLEREPMPAGLGLHPYFPSTDDTRLQTEVGSVQLTDGEALATGDRAAAAQAYDLKDRRISGSGLDHGFADWSGQADILYPDYVVRMTASPNARWLQVYAPVDEAYFCAEPVTHANDAFAMPEASWPDLGVRVLAQGESLHLEMQLQGLPR